jgi:uncharacterized protein YbaR (Trm112 family)
MPVPDTLLTVLRCPKSHSALRPASPEEAAALSDKWSHTNNALTPTGFLISTQGQWAYPERNGVPCLLVDEAIAL